MFNGFKNLMLCLCIIGLTSYSWADEIHLSNGDKITGKLISETQTEMTVETKAMGEIFIKKILVKDHVTQAQIEAAKRKKEGPQWDRSLSLGYTQANGNTDKSSFSGGVSVNRKTEQDEWTGKINSYLSTSDKKMDGKKFTGLAQYKRKLPDSPKWDHFAKLEASQDRFANVHYRLTPTYGIGYQAHDEDDFKLRGELAAGFEHTNYRDGTKSDNEAILVPRGYFEKVLFGDLRFKEDVTLYPSLSETGEFRLRAESILENPISEKMFWKLSFLEEFDSNPQGTAKKNDTRLVTSLDVKF